MVDLKSNPFFLSEEQISWVYEQKNSLSLEQKVGQLFLVMGGNYSINKLCEMVKNQGVGRRKRCNFRWHPIRMANVDCGH